jgi:hypothetical protein
MLISNYLCRRTVKGDTNFTCQFDSGANRRCPIFRIGYIIQELQEQDPAINLTALHQQVTIELKMKFQRKSLR